MLIDLVGAVPMIHDSTGGRASTTCHYSPSLVAEEQAHGAVSLKGEKALLEFLLDMVGCPSNQHFLPSFLSCVVKSS